MRAPAFSRSAIVTCLVMAVMTALPGVLAAPARAAVRGAGPRLAAMEQRADIVINSDAEFTADRGVRSGLGTQSDPYVISGWILPNLTIRNTSKWVTVRDNQVTGTMILDWIGDGVSVHHNQTSDLRVNQNTERTGDATSGTIFQNRFLRVGQLRHFDGVFTKNIVGDPDAMLKNLGALAMLVDGFNGGRITSNEFYGYVDMKLHGHHHSSAFGGGSHDHATAHDHSEPGHSEGMADHTRRYHEGWFAQNVVHSTFDYAFRYYDRNHTGDDRTAASETDKNLNCPHIHYTKIHVTDNRLVGAGVMVDVFNAVDDNHWTTSRGLIEIANNDIGLDRDASEIITGRPGILVQEADDVNVRIVGNEIVGADSVGEEDSLRVEELLLARASGIRLLNLDLGNVFVAGNSVYNRMYGVHASGMTSTVRWVVQNLYTENVSQDVYYDDTVANKPHRP
ncbi:MAG TPA: hypothetical protein VNC78_05045 [Actinomycetota bacterium]|nr:hypothetical protein [Actinomycetota bacterium]